MKNKILMFVCFGVFVFSGCKKFLEEENFNQFDGSNFPKSATDLRVLCNGFYNQMQHNDFYGFTYYLLSDLVADQFFASGTTGDRPQLETFNYTTTNLEMGKWWSRSYIIIARANTVIKQAENVSVSAGSASFYPNKEGFIAEAKFIRALTYFQLTNFFGDVPLITSLPDALDSLKTLKPSRTTQSLVFQQIIDDLLYAETYLLDESKISASYKGVPSNGAATALLAKVYLTRGYLPFADAADFQNAATKCQKLINGGYYKLLPDFNDIFDVTKENGVEHIFSIQFDQAPNLASTLIPFITPSQVYPRGFGSLSAERSFYNTFNTADSIRRKATYFDRGVGFTGISYNFIGSPTGRPFCGKYKDNNVLSIANDRTNHIVLRFADVLLMESEALNKIDPSDPAKYVGINLVRARAKIPLLPNTLNQADFETAILNERGWELAFEGKRRDDLIRLGKLIPVMTAAGKTGVRDYHKYFPIPQNEIDLNPNLKPQNTGY